MNIEKMTTTMQQAIAQAQQIAMTRHHQEIDIAHLWKIFLHTDHFGANFYKDLGINVDEFEAKVDQELDKISTVEGSNVSYGQSFSQNLYQLFIEADKIREAFQDEYLSTEVVILALMKLKHHVILYTVQ